MSLIASNYFHSSLLTSMLKSTLEFFETTPIGRIMNRFNRDIDSIERTIPESLKPLVKSLLQISFTIILIAYMLPLFTIPTVFIIILYAISQVTLIHTIQKY
jgi:ABC-type multidrug transport system fused ATPase/permease subunit